MRTTTNQTGRTRRAARRALLPVLAVLLLVPTPALADHAGNMVSSPVGIPFAGFVESSGNWEFVTNYPLGPAVAGPLGVDAVFVQRDEKVYALVSSVTTGFRVFDVTDPSEPAWVSDYVSAFWCPTAGVEGVVDGEGALSATTGWQNDMVVNQIDLDGVIGRGRVVGDGTIAAIGTDAGGRCHDPQGGGMEIVDISDLENPQLMWLTRQEGKNHNTGIDPWNDVLYTATSDGNDLIDIFDLRRCRTRAQGGEGTCQNPREVRYQFPRGLTASASGVAQDPPAGGNGCHDITARPGAIFCAAVTATVVFDVRRLRGRGGELTGDTLPCETVAAHPVYAGGREIVSDCTVSEQEFEEAGLRNARLRPWAVAHHDTSAPPDEDIAISHEADKVRGSPILMVTDERGGGLTNTSGCPGGGVHFYDIRPQTIARARQRGDVDPLGVANMRHMLLVDDDGRLVRGEDGQFKPAVFLTPHNPPYGRLAISCTAHNMEQWGRENRAFLAWYLSGNHVFDWKVDWRRARPTVQFSEHGWAVLVGPQGPSWNWSSYAFDATTNQDGTRDYSVIATDLARGVDFLEVTLPRAPKDVGRPGGGRRR